MGFPVVTQDDKDSEFTCSGPVLLRAAALPSPSARDAYPGASAEAAAPWPVRGADDDSGMRAYIAGLASVPAFMDAVSLASPSLADDARRIREGHPVRSKVLRRATAALTKYHLRMVQRPTPFGLFAGVALAELGARPGLDVGRDHRSVSRPDAAWLHTVLETLLTVRPVLRRTRLVANTLHTVRDGRLVLVDVHTSSGSEELAPSVRCTSVVRVIMRAAREPVAWNDLLREIGDRFPHATGEIVERCFEQLVKGHFLLTDLAPPPDCGTPLPHVLHRLEGLDHPLVDELRGIQGSLSALDSASTAHRHAALTTATDRMKAVATADHLLQADLAFDARLTLPVDVGDEAARAATALWRIAPSSPGSEWMRAYHARFLERYGTGRPVPVLELLDDARGLGLPDVAEESHGCRKTASGDRGRDRERGEVRDRDGDRDPARDRLLGELLWDAMHRGADEIVLDDRIIGQLPHEGRGRAPSSADMGAEVVAESWESLCAGDFRLVLGLSPVSPLATASFGRFAPALGESATARVQRLVERGRAAADGSELPVTVAFRPTVARTANVTAVPQWLAHRIPLGVGPASAATTQDLCLDNLAVRATMDRLELEHTLTGQRLRPLSYSMLNPLSGHFPHVARFLTELGRQHEQSYGAWSWGSWATAPALPRVRYGRSVLCPAHWTPDAALSAAAVGRDDAAWAPQVHQWQQRRRVPRNVLLCRGDHRIAVDLDNPLHLMLFRDELRRMPGLKVMERFGGAASNDWFRGPDGPHACELVFPVFRRTGARRHATPRSGPDLDDTTATARKATQGMHGTPGAAPRHLPGGQWLYAKLYVPEHHQPAVLARHLGRLTGPALASIAGIDTWFFLRYADPAPHLRLRFHGKPEALWSELLPALRTWTEELTDAGLLSRLTLDTYEPEVHRYGGPAALAHAEHFFHADSIVVLGQLSQPLHRRAELRPVSLAALGILDILSHLCTASEALQLLGGEPVLALRGTVQRSEKQALSALLDERGRAQPPAIGTGWEARRTALRGLRDALRRRAVGEGGSAGLPAVAQSLAHMHCNRFLGLDRDAEMLAHATAREALALRLNRMRHGR